MRKVFTVFICALSVYTINAQSLGWKTGFFGFFDNREYFNEYTYDRTLFGSRLIAEADFALDERNSFATGLNYLYEFGNDDDWHKPDFTLYYNYNGNINYYLGLFPRHQLINQPLVLLSDTIGYFRPNIEGMFIEYRRPFIYHNIWIDWTSKQGDEKKEIFMIGGSGRLDIGRFFYEHHFSFVHYALPSIVTPNDHIRDNGGIVSMVGTDLSHRYFFDTLCLSVGLVCSYDRLRHVYDTEISTGFYSELKLGYKNIGVNGTFYLGNGNILIYGDRFYRSDSYQRLDLYYKLGKSERIYGIVQFSAHFIPGTIDYSQLLLLRISLEGKKQLSQYAKD